MRKRTQRGESRHAINDILSPSLKEQLDTQRPAIGNVERRLAENVSFSQGRGGFCEDVSEILFRTSEDSHSKWTTLTDWFNLEK